MQERDDEMKNDYLWDRGGPVDMELFALERTLKPLRHRPRPSRWKHVAWGAVGVVAAAAILLCVIFLRPAEESLWALEQNKGEARVLRKGERVQTSNAELDLEAPGVGWLRLEPNSGLRVLGERGETERVALEYGSLRAVIWGPPAKFGVELPSATAVDLGCIYRLESNRNGNGSLSVEVGWVALQKDQVEAFIPHGASCTLRRNGPGLPVYDDSAEEFRQAVRDYEVKEATAQLQALLQAASPRDAITVWHIVQRGNADARRMAATRFAELTPLPADVKVTDLARAESTALDRAWDALDLGSTDWWRTWKQNW